MSDRWWFCLNHKAVEPDDGCKNADRLGPFGTRDEAARALETAAERTEAWDEEDKEWDERR
jgi:hypothetical protein